jgi:hypothetical protein
MRSAEFGEKLVQRFAFAAPRFLASLANGLMDIGFRGNVQQSLIRLGILDHRGGFAFHRKDDGSLALPELLHEVSRPPSECRERLDVLRNIEHGASGL